jgi:hypothetical protein
MSVFLADWVGGPVCQDGAWMTDVLTARLKQLLAVVDAGCDCPRCDVAEFQRLLHEHLLAAGAAYRPEHLRAAWEKPTPRLKLLPPGDT